jgi:hypothetical protein
MEYTISHIEITRRKKAYTTLSFSVIIGLFLASPILNFPISIGGYTAVAVALFLLGAFSYRFFYDLLKLKINLSNQLLERVVDGRSEKYLLHGVARVRVKWTTNSTIREVYIWLNGGGSVFITALDHFEEFKKELLDKLGKGVKIEEIHEPIDFDHPLFYSLLGLPISFVGVLICKLIPSLSYQNIQAGIIVFFIYLFILGTYFIVAKPISKRSGNKTVVSDYITGAAMICTGIILLLFFLNA